MVGVNLTVLAWVGTPGMDDTCRSTAVALRSSHSGYERIYMTDMPTCRLGGLHDIIWRFTQPRSEANLQLGNAFFFFVILGQQGEGF